MCKVAFVTFDVFHNIFQNEGFTDKHTAIYNLDSETSDTAASKAIKERIAKRYEDNERAEVSNVQITFSETL